MELNKQLIENGYILFKNVIKKDNIDNAYSCFFPNQKINYSCIKDYIENVMLKTIDEKMEWNSDYIKFRISDNNNSSDASTFHRDIIAQKEDLLIPSYTCLSYLDSAVMEIVPKSHLKLFAKIGELYNLYKSKVRLIMEPGDILLFNSTMLHRGVFTENNKTRKLIQVFEVFPNKDLLMEYKDKFVHVTAKEDYSYVMQFFSKFNISDTISNWIGYINSATGYGILPKKYLPVDDIYFLSSEGLRGREEIKEGVIQTNNRYVIKYETINLEDKYKLYFNNYCYNKKFVYTILFLFTLLLVIIYITYLLYKKVYL